MRLGARGTTGTREVENRAKEHGFLLRVDKLNSLKKSCSCAGPRVARAAGAPSRDTLRGILQGDAKARPGLRPARAW